MSGRKVFQLPKNPVAMLFIEIWRLKTKRVQIHILCATLPRFLLGKRYKAMPISATAKLVFYPQ